METELLRIQINDQLNRLLTQLEDLDELKDGGLTARRPEWRPSMCSYGAGSAEFEEKEWHEMKEETIQQLTEFEAFMKKSMKGDMTLVDEFGSAQLVRRAASCTVLCHLFCVDRLWCCDPSEAYGDVRTFWYSVGHSSGHQ